MKKDNYELVVEYDKTRFLKKNPIKIAEYANLTIEDENYIIVPHFNQEYAINLKTAAIFNTNDDSAPIPVMTRMVILHHLIEIKPHAKAANEFVTIHSLKDACVHEKAFNNRATIPLAKYFSNNLPSFIAAGKKLGGEISTGGDHSFILYAFPSIPLKFIFWDGDEEIPAAANILFDKNITDFTHPEDTIGLGEMGADLILSTAVKLKHQE
ncbi:MAG: DUF3786 domain-containing protein [Clostridiales bacterium]